MVAKIDSNFTGLRYAEEEKVRLLPTNATWHPLEPNSYQDFGGQTTLLARDPINPSRQRKKGVITDLDASGGFEQDLTVDNLTGLLQGFFFAKVREKATTKPLNAPQVAITDVGTTAKTYTLAGGVVGNGFAAGDIVYTSGFDRINNNGIKTVASSTATTIVVNETLTEETPTTSAVVRKVGVQVPAGDAKADVSTGRPRLTFTTTNPNTLNLIAGEWVFIGGDSAATAFDTTAVNGFARVRSVGDNFIEFDKTSMTWVEDAGASKTIQIFVGNVLKNEEDPTKIVQTSYQLERVLGKDEDGIISEYIVGAVPNELSLNIQQADKITTELSFVAVDNEQRTGLQGLKAGDRPKLDEDQPAFNTSSDFSRIKLHLVEDDTNPEPLFAFLSELSLTINNNVSPNKAIGTLGAFSLSAGTFEVSASITAYFADIAAVQAVRNNADVALDFAIVKNNAGMVWDIPLVSLGDGRLNVEKDNPITLPLTADAAKSEFGYTLLLNQFMYLPNLADL